MPLPTSSGRISTENLNSLLRDPSVLASVAGSPWDSFAKSLGLLGTEANARAAKCDSNLGDFYVALTMDATNFMLRGAMGADNADTAKIINNLANGFLRHAASYAPDKTGQNVINSLKLTATDNEVVLSADVPQQMVVDFLKSENAAEKTGHCCWDEDTRKEADRSSQTAQTLAVGSGQGQESNSPG